MIFVVLSEGDGPADSGPPQHQDINQK